MFKLCALVAISTVLVSFAQNRNLRVASNLLPHGVHHPPREHRFQIQIPGLNDPSKRKKSKRSESRIKRAIGGYAQPGQYGAAPPQYFQPQPQPSYSQVPQAPQQPYIPQPVQYVQLPPDPRYRSYLIQPQKQLTSPQGYQAPQSQQTVVSYYRPPQQQSVYQQQRLGVQVPPPVQQKNVVYQQQPQIQQRPNVFPAQSQVNIPQPQIAPAPQQQSVHQGGYQEGPYAGRKEVIQQRTTIYQERPQYLPNGARPVVRPAARPYQRFQVAPNPSNGGYDSEGYQETVPQPRPQPVVQQRPQIPQAPRPQPRPQPRVQVVDEGYGPSDQIQVSPAPVVPVTVPTAPVLPPQPAYIEEPFVPVQPVRTNPPVPVTRAPQPATRPPPPQTTRPPPPPATRPPPPPATRPPPPPATRPPPPPPPATRPPPPPTQAPRVETTPEYEPLPEPEPTPAPYDEPEPVEEECFYNPSGYICCNELLNDIIVETYQELENRPKFHTCNVQALVNSLQKKLEDTFNTRFETIAAYDDFSQLINYKKDLVCKVELNGRYILAYAAIGADDESKKVVRSISI